MCARHEDVKYKIHVYSNPGVQTHAALLFCPRAVVFCPAAHAKHAVAPKLCWYVP